MQTGGKQNHAIAVTQIEDLDSCSMGSVTQIKRFGQILNWSQELATRKSSYKEHRVDALAPYADEGRGKLRKATGSRKQALNRGYPNGGTRHPKRMAP